MNDTLENKAVQQKCLWFSKIFTVQIMLHNYHQSEKGAGVSTRAK